MNHISKLGFVAVLAVASFSASGDVHFTGSVTGEIDRLFLDQSDINGQCMVRVEGSNLANCAGNWISFDCGGEYGGTDVTLAYRIIDQLQLSIALGQRMRVYFNDTIFVGTGNRCIGTRVDYIK